MTPKTGLRVVLCISPYPSAQYVAWRISESKNVVGIVFERKRTAREILSRLLKRVKRRGVIKVLDEVMFRIFDVMVRRREKSSLVADMSKIESIPKIFVKSVNSPEAVKFIKDVKADVIVVNGTGILKKEVISLPPKGVINIHPGITPEYRGLEPIFWAIVNRDFGKIGVTIHFIDEGIDTGKIISQKALHVAYGDSQYTLFEKSIKLGSDMAIGVLSDMEKGRIKQIEKNAISNAYSRPGISNYLSYKRGLASLKKS